MTVSFVKQVEKDFDLVLQRIADLLNLINEPHSFNQLTRFDIVSWSIGFGRCIGQLESEECINVSIQDCSESGYTEVRFPTEYIEWGSDHVRSDWKDRICREGAVLRSIVEDRYKNLIAEEEKQQRELYEKLKSKFEPEAAKSGGSNL